MMRWEDRYVKGCCWQLLLLPWWLVPNDRPVEKGAFDNAAITIHRIAVPFTLFIFHLFAFVVGTDLKSKPLGLFCRLTLWTALCFFLWAANRCLKNSNNIWHIQITECNINKYTNPTSFSSLFSANPPPHMCQLNMQAVVGGGAFAAWWGYMLHCSLSREDNDEVHSAPIKAAASRPMD